VDGGREHRFVLVRLVRPLADGFEATAKVDLVSKLPDGPPVLVSDVDVGVAYERLRRLWALLGDRFELSLLATSTRWPDAADAADDEDDEEGDRVDEGALFEVASAGEVPGGVETLAGLILDRAVAYAEKYASFEALFGALEDDQDPNWVDIRVPALLAAAGRFDEAAAALGRYEPPEESDFFSRRERRTAYQLRRWVTSGGDESLLPEEPPPSRFEDRSRRRSFAQAMADSRARREAVEEVQETGRGRDRDQVRAMLEAALARRGLTESPFWFETTLDHLWDTPADRVRLGVQGLKALGRFGLGVAKAIREHELPDISTPGWLEPPDPAFYELPRTDRWISMSLDPDVNGWLERVHQAARPRVFGIASVDAWLKPEFDDSDVHKIGVYIGEKQVGLIPDDAVAAYLPAIKAATFREELPYLPARVARRDQRPSYMVELALPPS
jgi:hypothetical protein